VSAALTAAPQFGSSRAHCYGLVAPDFGSDAVELVLPPTVAAAARTRRCIEEHVQPRVSDETAGHVKLVVSELVNDAVVHGEGAITIRLDVLRDAVRVEVIDEGSGSTPEIRRSADEGGGWGLQIVEAVSRRWGVFEGSAHVWAEVPR
jgi:anti-sigma regulatory factor (Ser/Thr protein kinase)